MPKGSEIAGARAALGAALALLWLNFLLTAKWAALPGALNGPKRPLYGAALAAATIFVLRPRQTSGPVRLKGLGLLVGLGAVYLCAAFLTAFPPSTWTLLPFDDDWVPRFQSTVEGIELLRRGAVAGWQWAFLGGYHTTSDLTQSLTVVGFLPMTLLGDRVGFHLLHLALVAAIPLIVYFDVASDGRRDLARLSAFFALVCGVGMFGTLMPQGDTNSIVGVVCAMLVLLGSGMARLGRRAGGALMVVGLSLALYSHAAFFLYVVVLLGLEALFYRDWRMAFRAAAAIAVSVVAALPLYVEMLRYPEFFVRNNLLYAEAPIVWPRVARQVFYNVEILLHPHRWFNDYLSLTKVFLPVLVWLAFRPGRSRARFYAWAALAAIAMLRLNVVEAGYLFARAMHMLAPLVAVPLAWLVIDHTRDRRLAWALVAVVALYVQTKLEPIPHVANLREFDPPLVDRLASLDGNLILLENSPHRDLDQDDQGRTERTPFGVHFEAYLPEATGRRYYGQTWDTWHWSPFRGQVVAAGSFRGAAIGRTPLRDFTDELRKWGIRHLVVWSRATRQYLDAAPDRFTRRWQNGRWVHYELWDADTREVVAPRGGGTIAAWDPLGGEVHLSEVRKGDLVVVRANYFPAWTASAAGRDVPLVNRDGQLALRAPADGSYTVQLAYPRRTALLVAALAALVAGSFLVSRTCATPSSPSAAA